MREHRPELGKLYNSMVTADQVIWNRWTGVHVYEPDVTLAPDGRPYLYRWYVRPNDKGQANVLFHIQVLSDPERPLHDHPWDNVSQILTGRYDEIFHENPREMLNEGIAKSAPRIRTLSAGQVAFRTAETAHRLILPDDVPYVMTLFTHMPKRRDWGFWYEDGWHHNEEHVAWRGNLSYHVNRR